MSSALPIDKHLLVAPPKAKPPEAPLLVEVARKFGVSPFRQLREMLSLKYGPGKLAMHEYYSGGTFDPDMTASEKREFVGIRSSFRLNCRLSPLKRTKVRAFINNKVLYGALLERLGIPTTETQAVLSTVRSYGNIRTLREAEDIQQYLVHEAKYPLFGKPVVGSRSIGSVLINDIDRDAGLLLFANGDKVDISGFVEEVFETFQTGFIFQSAVQQHTDMKRITGDAVGTLRVVSIRDADGIRTLYSVWKIPAPTAMSDNFWQDGSMIAEIDTATGQLKRCKRGSGVNAEWIDAHPVNGEVFAGYQIPHWDAVNALAAEAHGLFPEFGVFGWDIAMTQDGPLIIECNASPFHTLYQLATGRGVMNEDFKPVFDAVAMESSPKLKAKHEAAKKSG